MWPFYTTEPYSEAHWPLLAGGCYHRLDYAVKYFGVLYLLTFICVMFKVLTLNMKI